MPSNEGPELEAATSLLRNQYEATLATFDTSNGSARNSLLSARTTAELFCLHVLKYGPCGRHGRREIDEMAVLGLDKLLHHLNSDDAVPTPIVKLLRTVQEYGNRGHGGTVPDEMLRPHAAVCREALEGVMTWFSTEYICAEHFANDATPSETDEELSDPFGEEILLDPWYTLSGSLSRADVVLIVAMCVPVVATVVVVVGAWWYFGASAIVAGILVGAILLIATFVRLVFKPARNEVKVSLAGCRRVTAQHPEQRIKIDSRIGWTATPVVLEGGVLYSFRTEGKIAHSSVSGWHDANGNPEPLTKRFNKLAGAERYNVSALVGRMGKDGVPFLVGAESRHRFEAENQLFLAINDWPRFDNKGELVLNIELANDEPD